MGTVEAIVGALGIGGVAIVAAIVLFLVARRTMKFVIRMAIFVVIVIALVAGGTALWYTRSGDSGNSSRPANTRRK